MRYSLFLIGIIILTASAYSGTNGGKFVTVSLQNGRYFFAGTGGEPFLSLGVNTIKPFDDSAPFGSAGYNGLKNRAIDAWLANTVSFLSNLGFNTAGSWSYPGLNGPFYYALQLKLGGSRLLVDIFDPIYITVIRKRMGGECAGHAGDMSLLGYFIDNDLPWYGDYPWYTGHSSFLFDQYLELDGSSPGKKRLVFFLRDKYRTIEALNKAWGTSYPAFEALYNIKKAVIPKKALEEVRSGFLFIAARHFYGLASKVVRSADPNHLLFSDRYANSVPEEVLKAAGEYCDVIAVNYYKPYPQIDRRFLDALAYYSQRPVFITEFAIRAAENSSGLKNAKGVNNTVKTQKERAERFKKYAELFLNLPYIIGYHWFQFFDEPSSGRFFDGEDSNYGIVDHDGNPYRELCDVMRSINTNAVAIRRNTKEELPKSAIPLDGRILVNRESGIKMPPVFLDISSGVKANVSFMCVAAASGLLPPDQDNKSLQINYKTGDDWGLTASLTPESPEYYEKGFFSAGGYKGVEIIITLETNVRFSINLNEALADAPDQDYDKVLNGADGESFSSEEALGTGLSKTYRFDFDSFVQRFLWGN